MRDLTYEEADAIRVLAERSLATDAGLAFIQYALRSIALGRLAREGMNPELVEGLMEAPDGGASMLDPEIEGMNPAEQKMATAIAFEVHTEVATWCVLGAQVLNIDPEEMDLDTVALVAWGRRHVELGVGNDL